MARFNNRSDCYPTQVEFCLPDRQRAIARLRQSNAVFAEICQDYELLAGDLSALSRTGPCSHPRIRAERDLLLESLQGLVREIETALGRARMD